MTLCPNSAITARETELPMRGLIMAFLAIDFAGLGGTDLVGAVLALTQARDRIAVAAHRRHESSSASRVRDLILRSRGPVLVIPG